MDTYSHILSTIQELLKKNPQGLTVSEISKEIATNRNSTAKYLAVLLISGHVQKRILGPAKIYCLSHRVPVNALLNISSDRIIVIDNNRKITQVNINLLACMQVKEEALIGKKFKETIVAKRFGKAFTKAIEKALKGEEYIGNVTFVLRGKTIHLRVKIIPTTFEDGTQGATGILEDVSKEKQIQEELRKTHERLQHILSSSPAVIYSCKPTGDFPPTFISENLFEQTGYTTKEFLKSDTFWSDRIHSKDKNRVLKNLKQLFEKDHHIAEYRFRLKNGKYQRMRDEIKLFRDKDGNPTEMVGYWIKIEENVK